MSSVAGGLQVSLHPLPILNISEHLTRVSLQLQDPNVRRGLLGTQVGRQVEIMNTFELVISLEEGTGKVIIDGNYFNTRKDQFKQVFPTFDFLGWYSVGNGTSAADMEIHKQFFEYNEAPLFLQLSTLDAASTTSKVLPIQIYETTMEIINNESEISFIGIGYDIETGEAERVAVDHVSKADTAGKGSQSSLIATLTTQRNAIKMLHDRVTIILEYLNQLNLGTVEKDQETLRQIGSLITSIPALNSVDFQSEFMTEYNDVLLTTYLASMTKELNTVNVLLDKQLLLVTSNNSNSSASNRNEGPGGRMSRRAGKGFGSNSDFH